jgi:hypothetical protein
MNGNVGTWRTHLASLAEAPAHPLRSRMDEFVPIGRILQQYQSLLRAIEALEALQLTGPIAGIQA